VLSFETAAETAVVPPGTTLEDSGDKTTEMDRDCDPGCVPGSEKPPPHPKLNSAKIMPNEKMHLPLVPFFKLIRPLN
jgi:hypothetical protein